MNKFLRMSLLVLLIFGGRQTLLCQNADSRRWDELLDRFERICRMSLDIKASGSQAGADLAPLLSELSDLREEIKDAGDSMPVAARRRYEAIRQMYYSGVVSDTRIVRLPSGLPDISPVPAAFTSPSELEPLFLPGNPPSPEYHFGLSASAAVLPEFSAGLMAEYLGRRFGAYIAFRSNFSNHHPSYEALSDGTSSYGPVWTTGASAVDRFFVTAGPAVRLNRWLSLYGGLGYGSRMLCWEDSEGGWMKVGDASLRGLCAEFGASAHLGRIILSAGWLSLPTAYGALTVSVGYGF